MPSRAPALMGDLPSWCSRGGGLEFWQRDGLRDRLVGDLDLHIADDLVEWDADDVAVHPRPLIQLNHGDRVGHLLSKSRMIDAVIDHIAEHTAAAARLGPGPVRRIAARAKQRRRKPIAAAIVATR